MTWKKMFVLVITSIFATQVSAATFVIQNNDGADEGFNDPLPPPNANQKGNNPGTTLGEMRLNVFQAAADVWAAILNSNVTITVGGTFDEKFCSPDSATLGSAGANGSAANFGGLEPDLAYAIALAESLSDSNLNGVSVEIVTSFNSLLDSDPNCLGGGGFYYGLDDNAPVGTTHLYPVVLHELAHGLGFASMADVGDGASGTFFGAGGFPDTFSRRLLDLDNNKSWDEMSNAERLVSALNEPEVVWEGAQVTADLDQYLDSAPELVINAPVAIIGTFEAVAGEKSATIPPGGVTAGIVDGNTFNDINSDPATGCSQIGFGGTFTGKIVLFDSTPDCSPVVAAFFTQYEGAAGLIIADTSGSGFPDMSGSITNAITIPYIGIEESVADDLRANLATANVTIQTSSNKFLGENQGKVKMYAPAIFETGSSVSHWSRTASPDLLMEPVLGDLDFADVDLTAAAFRDIGWSVNIPGEKLELIFKDSFE
jgi:hypothetical protein